MQALFDLKSSGSVRGEAASLPAFSLRAVDIRAKIFLCIAASVTTIWLGSFMTQSLLVFCSFLYALVIRRPKILFTAYVLAVLMLTLAFFCMQGIHTLFPVMPAFGLDSLSIPFLRMITMLNVILPLALTSGIQPLLTFLKTMRLPFCLYIPAAVMIRFIPTFMADIRQVWETIRIRGYRLTPLKIMRHPRLFLRLMFTPILFRALRTSEELGVAAELKGLGYAKTLSPYKRMTWTRRDTLLVITAALILAGAVAWEISMGDAVPKGIPH